MLLLVLGLSVGACSKKETPEARVRALIATWAQAAEAGDTATLRARISERYADSHGNDRRAIDGLLRLYVLQHRPLYIYTRISSVDIEPNDRAQVVIRGNGR